MRDLSTHVRQLQSQITINLDKARRMLLRDEGSRPYPYDDASGKFIYGTGRVTVGIGRNLEANPLSDIAIDLLLLEDLTRAEAGARRILGNSNFQALTENRKLAVINLVFNLGEDGFSKFSTTIKFLKERDYESAALNLLKSKYATQVKTRANRVSEMIRKDDFPYE